MYLQQRLTNRFFNKHQQTGFLNRHQQTGFSLKNIDKQVFSTNMYFGQTTTNSYVQQIKYKTVR